MNTYPTEYLLHPVPVLALYGIAPPTTEQEKQTSLDSNDTSLSSSSRPASSPSTGNTPPSPRTTLANSLFTLFHSKQDCTLYEATRPPNTPSLAPSSSSAAAAAASSAASAAASSASSAAASTPFFRVISLPKDYVLPTPLPTVHSALSPLHPQSPLFPDGLISPSWIKKHLETPSVVVGVYEVWDWTHAPGQQAPTSVREVGPLGASAMMDPTEREKDIALAQEINDRRKYFQDKGIRFACVLLLKARQTEDPGVGERLNLIKKQSGLDTKNTFFTIAPGPHHELQEFIHTLYRSLHEPALQYYSHCIKKTRKKRSKLPSPQSSARPSMADLTSHEPQPLSFQGWTLRYEFKVAFFQEMRQDIESAVKTYETAYHLLGDILAPTSSMTQGLVNLSARGKRWTDARTLADCINIKICRFHLYLNDPSAALAQMNVHLHLFQTYSNAWGMGEQSFEYWTWLSKQYRIFADIVDHAIQYGFKVPIPTAYLTSPGTANRPGSPLLATTGGHLGAGHQALGCNPTAILQHPGFYYHIAAMCCAERRRKFLTIERIEAEKIATATTTATATATPTQLEALLSKERQVDHSSLTIEFLTKSYEQFKKYRNGRMTLYLAAEIAGSYYEAGKYEMALKFFERIGKTYRKENWHRVLTSILRWSLRCAKELGSWERALECLVELMAEELPMTEQKRIDNQKEMMDILYHHPVANTVEHAPLTLAMDQMNAFIKCSVQFLHSTSFVDTPVLYQITLSTEEGSPLLPFHINAMRIVFSDPQYNCCLKGGSEEENSKALELVDFSQRISETTEGVEGDGFIHKMNLTLSRRQTRVFQGAFVSKDCEDIKIVGICLDLVSPHWNVALSYNFDKSSEDQTVKRRRWLEPSTEPGGHPKFKFLNGRGELNTVKIQQKPPRIQLSLQHTAPALLDEYFEMSVTITSEETEIIHVSLHVEIKNTEGQVGDYVWFKTSDNALHSQSHTIEVGPIEPGTSATFPFYLYASQMAGIRTIDLKADYAMSSADKTATAPRMQKSESVQIPFVAPFDCLFEVCAQSESVQKTVPFGLERSEKWLMIAALQCCSPWELDVESVVFEQENFVHPSLSLSLVSKMDNVKQIWKTGHVYNVNYLFRLSTTDVTEPTCPVPVGTLAIQWKRSGQTGSTSTSVIKMPMLELQSAGLVVVADVPPQLFMAEPFTLTYTVHNPTIHLAEYTASIELGDAFVFSGYKQLKGRVLPLSRASYYYTCYPLQAGKVKLPRLKLSAKQQGIEREVPIEFLGSGAVLHYTSALELQLPSAVNEQPTLIFVGAKRHD
ncbi:Gryzun, putative trafficking through golgi-domain-containing protein [Spinellus fusiger]|nr:Gryzun, putative trafficking through golgi-domain-containing protein [Spinellus fusiger]